MSHEKELPLDILLTYLRNSVDASIEVGYVTVSLAENMRNIQAHSSMSTKNLSRIITELERYGRLNAEDVPILIEALKPLVE